MIHDQITHFKITLSMMYSYLNQLFKFAAVCALIILVWIASIFGLIQSEEEEISCTAVLCGCLILLICKFQHEIIWYFLQTMNLSCWDGIGSQHIYCRYGMAVGFWWQADLWKYVKQIFNKKVNFAVIWFVSPLKSVECSILRLVYGA